MEKSERKMIANTKESVREHVILCTVNLLEEMTEEKLNECTTTAISNALHLSRNLTSQYLNGLVKEGVLAKVPSRPVYFVERESMEKVFGESLEELEECNGQEFLGILRGRKKNSIFGALIGSDTSLEYCIEQCKAAVKYPESGLPILLSGESGTGRRLLANLLFQYGIAERIISSEGKFYALECSQLEKTPEGGMKEIFGHSGIVNGKKVVFPGLLEKADKGVLFISNASSLGMECQKKIAEYLERRAYGNPGQKEKKLSRARLIFSVTPELHMHMNKELLTQIPVVCDIPSLQNRRPEEKEMLIMKFFRDEEEALKRDIQVSSQVFRALIDYLFQENISQLKNCIKVICANAFFRQENEKKMKVLLYHLPESMLAQTDLESLKEDNTFLDIGKRAGGDTSKRIISYYSQILMEFGQWKKQKKTLHEFVKYSTKCMNLYYDHIIYERKYDNRKVKAMEAVIQKFLELVSGKNDIFLPVSCGYALARNVYLLTEANSEILLWENENMESVQECYKVLAARYPMEAQIASSLKESIEGAFHIRTNVMSIAFIILHIRFYNKGIPKERSMAVVAAAGYLTAGAIADTVNKALGKHVFDFVDIQTEHAGREIVEKVSEHLRKEFFCKKIYLFTDIEEGEEAAKEISARFQIEVAWMNRMGIKILLDAGRQILREAGSLEVLETVSKSNPFRYQIFKQEKSQPAILFASEAGDVLNQRIIYMFEESILKNKGIQMISYNTSMLLLDVWEETKNKYDLLFVLGTQNPGINEIPFIPLEDIVSFQNLEQMNRILRAYLTAEEIRGFNETLVKNFTLQNVISQLTILDGNTLMDYIDKSVKHLQAELRASFSASTIIGISIHLACMVERLVTKTEIGVTERAEKFLQHHGDFINKVRKSFEGLTHHYYVEIPVSEVLYIYDYINNENSGNKGEEDF